MAITKVQRMRIAAEACVDVRTVERVLAGEGRELTRSAVIEAANRLGIVVGVTIDAPPTRLRAS